MQFIIYSEDKADSLAIRKANRDAHLNWLKTDTACDLLAAGPWLDDDGEMRGSLLIVEAADKASVISWTERDPYKKAGLPGAVTIRAFKWVIGAPS